MDLQRMLGKCRRDQWSVDDLDWSSPPRPMSEDDEMAIVQYFTDMAGIERLAKALFQEQCRRVEDETLRQIFATFVVDEERHAVAAERLAKHYDLRRLRNYQLSPHLIAFRKHFLNAIRLFSAEVANAYITAGELILDIALLRSIDDYVSDDMSRQAMRLINRDESRHIAIDYHMIDLYVSPEYQARLDAQPRPSLRERATATASFASMLYYAAPFFREVFFRPMSVVDPNGKRLREAFKRMQLVSRRPGVRERPFMRLMVGLQEAYNKPLLRRVLGPLIARAAGVPGSVLMQLYTDEEFARAQSMSIDELAEEALAAKLEN